jgi:hypothetical protein
MSVAKSSSTENSMNNVADRDRFHGLATPLAHTFDLPQRRMLYRCLSDLYGLRSGQPSVWILAYQNAAFQKR